MVSSMVGEYRDECIAVSLCACCGQPAGDRSDLCGYHTLGDGGDWAAGNRIMCDFIHRGIVPHTPRDTSETSIDVLGMEVVLAA